MRHPTYNARNEVLLDLLAKGSLTEHDFRSMALVCADQGGVSIKDQREIAARLGIKMEDV